MATDANKDVKVTLYWLEKSRSQRILWLLEELQIPYELKRFKRDEGGQADPELKKIHPLGKSPVISIQSPKAEKPLILAESALIIEYLTEHFGPHLNPKRYNAGSENVVGGETESWIRNRYFMHYSEGSLMPYFMIQLVVNKIRDAPVPFFIKPITRMITGKVNDTFLQPNIKNNMDFLEEQIKTSPGGGRYLCGDELTSADIMMSFNVQIAVVSKLVTEKDYPALFAYAKLVEERESYKRAVDTIVKLEGSYDVVPQ